MQISNLIVPSRSGSRTHAANQSNDQFRQLLGVNYNLHSFLLPGRLENAKGTSNRLGGGHGEDNSLRNRWRAAGQSGRICSCT